MRGPPISSRRASASSTVVDRTFQARTSLSDPLRTALRRRPVVGQHQHQCPVELAPLVEPADQPADLGVGVGQVAGEGLHVAGVDPPGRGGQRRPGGDPVRSGRQLGVRGQEAAVDLAPDGVVAPAVPTGVEVAPVAGDPIGRRLVRRVAGPRGEVQQPRLVDLDVAQVLEELDRPGHEVLRQVVAVLVRARGLDDVVVVHQCGHELVGLAAEEAVEPLEAPPQRPTVPAGAQVLLFVRGEVPLPHGVGRVAQRGQHGREQAARTGNPGVVAGEPRGQLNDAAHAARVVVAARQHARPGRAAQPGRVEVRVAQPRRGEAVEGGRGDVGAEAPQLREPDVVEQHDQHVGCARRRRRLGRPVRLRLPVVATDPAPELATFHRLAPSPCLRRCTPPGRAPAERLGRHPTQLFACQGTRGSSSRAKTSTPPAGDVRARRRRRRRHHGV